METSREKKKNKYYLDPVLRERHCKRCRKLFIPAPQHRFKIGGAYYCSWTCYNHRNDPKEGTIKNDEDNKN